MATKWERKPHPKGNLHPDLVTYVYENTMDSAALRKAICNICVYGMEASKLAERIRDYPPEFVAEYAVMQTKRATGEMPPKPSISFITDDLKNLNFQAQSPGTPGSEIAEKENEAADS
jgi:hypothetical protein